MFSLRHFAVLLALAACGAKHTDDTVIGPRLGESRAGLPSDPSVPPPDAAGATEISSGPISVAPRSDTEAAPTAGEAEGAGSGSAAPLPTEPGPPPPVFTPPPDAGVPEVPAPR
jgi:hypothetical protein